MSRATCTAWARAIGAGGLVVLSLLIAMAPGCAGGAPGSAAARRQTDPLLVAVDSTATSNQRAPAVREAYELMKAGSIEHTAWREAMKRLAWRRSDPASVRVPAINVLAEDNPDDTAAMLNLLLPTETQWPVIDRVCALAIEHKWTALTPGLVRSWSRKVPEPVDADRPERKALLALHPGQSAEEIAFAVFAAPEQGALADKVRGDAWALLSRLDTTGDRTRALLEDLARQRAASGEGAPADPLLDDLLAGAAQLGAVPRTTEQLEWLRSLRAPEHAAFWTAAADAVARLSMEQRAGWEFRHLSALCWAVRNEPGWVSQSREALLEQVRRGLEGIKRHQRVADASDYLSAPKETLEAWKDRLVWGDLLLILIAQRAIADPGVIQSLMEQAAADIRDESTEYGGVLDWRGAEGTASGGSFEAESHPPRPTQRIGDNRFIASPDLLAAGITALFHYHFHAQTWNYAEYAGPGPGDMEYAQTFGRSCIVFTGVSRDVLDADYYQPNGARIDLGEVRKR